MRRIFYIYFILAILYPDLCTAQSKNDSIVASCIQGLEKVWMRYRILILEKQPIGYLSSAKLFFSLTDDPGNSLKTKTSWLLSSADKFDRNPGVDWVAGWYQNFRSNQDENMDLSYRQRFQTGIDWNFLKDGLIANDLKAKQLRNEAKIEQLLSNESAYIKNISYRSAQIIYLFNKEKIKILSKRKNILEEKSAIIFKLNQAGVLSNIERIKMEQAIIDMNYELQLCQEFNDVFKHYSLTDSIDFPMLPLLDFKLEDYLASSSGLEPEGDSILKLQITNAALASDLRNRIGLKGSIRYNAYDPFNADNKRSFFSAGLGISIPLALTGKETKKEIFARNEWLKNKLTDSDKDKMAEQFKIYFEYKTAVKNYLNLYQKNKITREQLRIERVKNEFKDATFNPVEALNLIDEMLVRQIDMTDLKQQSYLQLIRLSSYNSYQPISNFIDVIKPDSVEGKILDNTFKTSVYVWSDTYKNSTSEFLSEFLSHQKISNAIISIKSDASNADLKGYHHFIETLKRYNITTELLIGNNNLIFKPQDQIVSFLDSLLKKTGTANIMAIHLDVEPHTFADYKQKEDKYLSDYIKMLSTVRLFAQSKNLKLNVSIPLRYPAKYLKQIFEICDGVYFMCYENINIETLTRKINEAASYGKNKINVSLRTEDFESFSDLLQLLKQINSRTGINAYTIHDLKRMVEMEK